MQFLFRRLRLSTYEAMRISGMLPDTDSYDVGVVHELSSDTFQSVDDVLVGIKSYNQKFQGEGFNDDPAFVAYSLLKAVEFGAAEAKIE